MWILSAVELRKTLPPPGWHFITKAIIDQALEIIRKQFYKKLMTNTQLFPAQQILSLSIFFFPSINEKKKSSSRENKWTEMPGFHSNRSLYFQCVPMSNCTEQKDLNLLAIVCFQNDKKIHIHSWSVPFLLPLWHTTCINLKECVKPL